MVTSASISGPRRPGSIRTSLLLSSLRRAPGPRFLTLLGAGPGAGAGVGPGAGAGAGAATVGGVGGFRAPELFLSWLLDWAPPLQGDWNSVPGVVTFRMTWQTPRSLLKLTSASPQLLFSLMKVWNSLLSSPSPAIPAEAEFNISPKLHSGIKIWNCL